MSTPISRLGMRVSLGTGVGLAEPLSGPNIGTDPVEVRGVGGFGGGIRSASGLFRDPAASDVMSLLIEARTGTIESLIACAEKAGSGDVGARSILRSFIRVFSQLYYRDFAVLDTFCSACDPGERSSELVKGVYERIDEEGFDALADYAACSENCDQRAYELIEWLYDNLVEYADEPDDDLIDWLGKNAPLTLVNLRAVKDKDAHAVNRVPGFRAWVERWNAAFDTDRCVSLDARFDDAMFTLFGEFIDVAKRNHIAYRVLGYLTTEPTLSYFLLWAGRCELNERSRLTPRAEARAKRTVDECIASGEYHRMVDLCPLVLYGDPSASRVIAYLCEQTLKIDGALGALYAWLERSNSLFFDHEISRAASEARHIHDAIKALVQRGEQGAYRLMEGFAVMGDDRSKAIISLISADGAYPESVRSLAHFRESARFRRYFSWASSDAAWNRIHESVMEKIEGEERMQELTPSILRHLANDGAWLHSDDARAMLWNEDDLDLNRLFEVAFSMAEYEDETLMKRAMEQLASTARADEGHLAAFIMLMQFISESDWWKALIDRFDPETLRTQIEREPMTAFWIVNLAQRGSVSALEAVREFEKVDILEIDYLRKFAKAGNDAAKRLLAKMEAGTEDDEDAEVIPFQKPE